MCHLQWSLYEMRPTSSCRPSPTKLTRTSEWCPAFSVFQFKVLTIGETDLMHLNFTADITSPGSAHTQLVLLVQFFFPYPFFHFLSLSIKICLCMFSILFLFYTDMSTTLHKLRSIKHKHSCVSCTCAHLKSMWGPALGAHMRQAEHQTREYKRKFKKHRRFGCLSPCFLFKTPRPTWWPGRSGPGRRWDWNVLGVARWTQPKQSDTLSLQVYTVSSQFHGSLWNKVPLNIRAAEVGASV